MNLNCFFILIFSSSELILTYWVSKILENFFTLSSSLQLNVKVDKLFL